MEAFTPVLFIMYFQIYKSDFTAFAPSTHSPSEFSDLYPFPPNASVFRLTPDVTGDRISMDRPKSLHGFEGLHAPFKSI